MTGPSWLSSREPPAWCSPWLRVQLRIRLVLDTNRSRPIALTPPAALNTVLHERRGIRSAGWFN